MSRTGKRTHHVSRGCIEYDVNLLDEGKIPEIPRILVPAVTRQCRPNAPILRLFALFCVFAAQQHAQQIAEEKRQP